MENKEKPMENHDLSKDPYYASLNPDVREWLDSITAMCDKEFGNMEEETPEEKQYQDDVFDEICFENLPTYTKIDLRCAFAERHNLDVETFDSLVYEGIVRYRVDKFVWVFPPRKSE